MLEGRFSGPTSALLNQSLHLYVISMICMHNEVAEACSGDYRAALFSRYFTSRTFLVSGAGSKKGTHKETRVTGSWPEGRTEGYPEPKRDQVVNGEETIPAPAQATGKGSSPLPAQPLSWQGRQCSGPASFRDRTKGRLWSLPVHLQKWCVIAWPLGILSHHAWETPWSPNLPPTCWSETISFSWSEWLSLRQFMLACDGQSGGCTL